MSSTPQVKSLAPLAPAEPATSNPILAVLDWFGEFGMFLWRVLRSGVTPPYEFGEFFRQLDEVGSSLVRFGAKSLLPATVVFSVISEMGPILTGLIVSGRVGAGIGAELSAMRVTEQIDAIEASAVDPYKLLAATRILACIVALPLLTLAASACGVFMGWVTATLIEPITLQHFISTGFKGASLKDFLPPTFKTSVYGLIIGSIACFTGMRAKGGAEGVGSAATTSVVLSSLFVILADVILVKLILLIFP